MPKYNLHYYQPFKGTNGWARRAERSFNAQTDAQAEDMANTFLQEELVIDGRKCKRSSGVLSKIVRQW